MVHLRDQGIREFVLAVKTHADKIQSYFQDGQALGVHIEYAYEQSLLGTAGAIKNAEHLLDGRFLVFNADIVHLVNVAPLLEFHERHGGLVTIGLTEVNDPSHYGVVELTKQGEILRFVEKPKREEAPSNHINAGIYVMETSVLDWIPKNRETSIERETFPALIDHCVGVYGMPVDGYWLDMGTVDRYMQLHDDIFAKRAPVHMSYRMTREGVWMGKEARVHPGATIIPPVVIGEGAVVQSGCTVGPYVSLGDHAVVRAGASVSRSIVWPGATVGSEELVSDAVVGRTFVTQACRPAPSAAVREQETANEREPVMQR